MIKLFSIIMSGLILVQGFEITIGDFTQMDELIDHANFHAEKYGDTIWVFISKHYGDLKEPHNKDHQEERRDHEKLPFQNHCSCNSAVAIVLNTKLAEITTFESSESRIPNFYYQPPTSSLHVKGLFQPPQFA